MPPQNLKENQHESASPTDPTVEAALTRLQPTAPHTRPTPHTVNSRKLSLGAITGLIGLASTVVTLIVGIFGLRKDISESPWFAGILLFSIVAFVIGASTVLVSRSIADKFESERVARTLADQLTIDLAKARSELERQRKELEKFQPLAEATEILAEVFDLLSSGHVRLGSLRGPQTKEDDINNEEKDIVEAALAKVARIFRVSIGSEVKVSLKLALADGTLAQTFVRSERHCQRDTGEPVKAVIGNGTNTGLDRAAAMKSGHPQYFFCNDLESLADYENCRPNWRLHYLSTIVVPLVNPISKELFGFLCVDSKRKRCFSEAVHVPLMRCVSSALHTYMTTARSTDT